VATNAELPLLIDKAKVCELVSCPLETLDELLANGQFPKPVVLGTFVRWPRSVILGYVRDKQRPEGGEPCKS
jgi:predicted DNA-binding transcriptional regulator AlpA